jgi:hypothetical protein
MARRGGSLGDWVSRAREVELKPMVMKVNIEGGGDGSGLGGFEFRLPFDLGTVVRHWDMGWSSLGSEYGRCKEGDLRGEEAEEFGLGGGGEGGDVGGRVGAFELEGWCFGSVFFGWGSVCGGFGGGHF